MTARIESEAGWTPGPWLCQSPDDDGSISIIGDNLGGLVGAAHCWPTEVDAGGSDRVRANARLIAAAPELVEALRNLTNAAGATTGFASPMILKDAQRILARIEGRDA